MCQKPKLSLSLSKELDSVYPLDRERHWAWAGRSFFTFLRHNRVKRPDLVGSCRALCEENLRFFFLRRLKSFGLDSQVLFFFIVLWWRASWWPPPRFGLVKLATTNEISSNAFWLYSCDFWSQMCQQCEASSVFLLQKSLQDGDTYPGSSLLELWYSGWQHRSFSIVSEMIRVFILKLLAFSLIIYKKTYLVWSIRDFCCFAWTYPTSQQRAEP